MSKKVKVSIEVTYDFVDELLAEYLEQLGDHRNTSTQRAWFAIDRMIGDQNFFELRDKGFIDPMSVIVTTETE